MEEFVAPLAVDISENVVQSGGHEQGIKAEHHEDTYLDDLICLFVLVILF